MTDNPREALLARLREAKGADRRIDAAIARMFDLPKCENPDCFPDIMEKNLTRVENGGDDEELPEYTGSIDAAVALKNRVRPGSRCILIEDVPCRAILKLRPFVSISGYAATPAIALVTALLMSIDDG